MGAKQSPDEIFANAIRVAKQAGVALGADDICKLVSQELMRQEADLHGDVDYAQTLYQKCVSLGNKIKTLGVNYDPEALVAVVDYWLKKGDGDFDVWSKQLVLAINQRAAGKDGYCDGINLIVKGNSVQ